MSKESHAKRTERMKRRDARDMSAAKKKQPQRHWVATHENEQVTVSRADGFLSIDTAYWDGKWRGNESLAIDWELVPKLISALQQALEVHEKEEE